MNQNAETERGENKPRREHETEQRLQSKAEHKIEMKSDGRARQNMKEQPCGLEGTRREKGRKREVAATNELLTRELS